MTREEAKELASDYESLCGNKQMKYVIDDIYDDIESRICENCQYYDYEGNFAKNKHMECKLFFIETREIVDTLNFGCNKFKRKVESK